MAGSTLNFKGNVQEIAYTYAQDESLPGIVQVPRQDEDPSFEYFDNARGKINFGVLEQLVSKFNAEDHSATEQQKLGKVTKI